jgi:hypothetical protein
MAISIQKMFRRQWGVPAFRSKPALARRGTRHCMRSPMVISDSDPRFRVSDAAE